MEIRYKTRKGEVITAQYNSDAYELKEGERWVSTKKENEDDPVHHFVINEGGTIVKGFGGKFNGLKPSEIGKPSIEKAPIGTIASEGTLVWKKTKDGWDLYHKGKFVPKDEWLYMQGEQAIKKLFEQNKINIEYPNDNKVHSKSIQDILKAKTANTTEIKEYMKNVPVNTRIEFTKASPNGASYTVNFKKTQDGWVDDAGTKESEDFIAISIKDQVISSQTKSVREIDKQTQEKEFKEKQNPKTIATVPQGKPMTREQANNKSVNPHHDGVSASYDGYNDNCQSCVVAFEARLRGYDVQVHPNNKHHPQLENLSHHSYRAWLNEDGKSELPLQDETVTTWKKCRTWLEQIVGNNGERYTFGHQWKGHGKYGHIISLDRDENGNLRLYDPQCGRTYQDKELDKYLARLKYKTSLYGMKISCVPRVLRVDNKAFNPYYMNDIMTKAGTPYEHK